MAFWINFGKLKYRNVTWYEIQSFIFILPNPASAPKPLKREKDKKAALIIVMTLVFGFLDVAIFLL